MADLDAQRRDAPDPTVALLESWIAEAPTDALAVADAEEDLHEFKRSMNRPRKEVGAPALSRGGMSPTAPLDTELHLTGPRSLSGEVQVCLV